MTKQIYNWCKRYLYQVTSNNLRSLTDVYVKPSSAKKAAWSSLQVKCRREGGWGLSILCSNMQTFTAAFMYKDVNGEPVIRIVSRTRTIDVYASALSSYKEAE